jgi:hypothetical protein
VTKKRRRAKKSPTYRRALDHSAEPITHRLQYLCEFVCGGDCYEMARQLGVCHRHFHTVYDGRCRVSIRMAAQIISRFGVRADWLLNGTGPMFATITSEMRFELSPAIRSSFPVTPVSAAALPPPSHTEGAEDSVVDPMAYQAAAGELFLAGTRASHVILCVGAEGEADYASIVPLLSSRGVTGVFMTLAAAKIDAAPAIAAGAFDLNNISRFAACTGRGYAEAIASKLHSKRSQWPRTRSLLVSAYDAGLAVALQAVIGEIDDHFCANYGGAELGAAIGAAAYVDQLVLDAHMRAALESAGPVIICSGESARWQQVLRRYDLRDATLILRSPANGVERWATQTARVVVPVENSSAVFFRELLAACSEAYAAGEVFGG